MQWSCSWSRGKPLRIDLAPSNPIWQHNFILKWNYWNVFVSFLGCALAACRDLEKDCKGKNDRKWNECESLVDKYNIPGYVFVRVVTQKVDATNADNTGNEGDCHSDQVLASFPGIAPKSVYRMITTSINRSHYLGPDEQCSI